MRVLTESDLLSDVLFRDSLKGISQKHSELQIFWSRFELDTSWKQFTCVTLSWTCVVHLSV